MGSYGKTKLASKIVKKALKMRNLPRILTNDFSLINRRNFEKKIGELSTDLLL